MKKKKRSRKKQKQPEKKLNKVDHILYFLIISLLCLLFFISPLLIEILRTHMFHINPDVLAYADGPGLLWMLVPIPIGAVGIIYFFFAVSKNQSVKETMAFLFRKKILSVIVIVLCLVIYLTSFSLSLFSSRCEFRTDGFYDCSIFGSQKIGDISSVQKVKWEVDTTNLHHSFSFSLCCNITINGEEIVFVPFGLERVLAVNDILSGIPTERVNRRWFERWLRNYKVDDATREKIYEKFGYSEN